MPGACMLGRGVNVGVHSQWFKSLGAAAMFRMGLRFLHIVLVLLYLCVGLGVGVSGCALFGGDEAFEFPITARKDVDITVTTALIPGAGSGVASPVEVTIPIPPVDVDIASASADLEENKNKLKSIKIEEIIITPSNNTLTEALPPIQLFVGPPTGQAGEDILIATIPSITAGQTAQVKATIDSAGMEAAQVYIKTLRFVMRPAMTVAAGQKIPGGGVDLNLELAITAVVDPTL